MDAKVDGCLKFQLNVWSMNLKKIAHSSVSRKEGKALIQFQKAFKIYSRIQLKSDTERG